MTSRILITGSNADMPHDAAQRTEPWWVEHDAKRAAVIHAEVEALSVKIKERQEREYEERRNRPKCPTCHGLRSTWSWNGNSNDVEECLTCGR